MQVFQAKLIHFMCENNLKRRQNNFGVLAFFVVVPRCFALSNLTGVGIKNIRKARRYERNLSAFRSSSSSLRVFKVRARIWIYFQRVQR